MVNSKNLVTTYVLVVWIIEIFMNYHDKDNSFCYCDNSKFLEANVH